VTSKERVLAALEHREGDRIPWGEHSIDYNVYEDILGRPTLCQSKMRETQAYWDGRRDEIVECYKRDRVDLIRALEMDIAFVGGVPPKDYKPEPMEKVSEGVYRDEEGSIFHVSATTHDLMPYKRNTAGYVMPTVEGLQKQIDELDANPDLPGYAFPDPADSRYEFIRHMVKELGKTHFVLLLCGDTMFPIFGATEEEAWMNMVLYPDIAAKQAELEGKKLIRDVRVFAQLGVDGIMPCGDLGSSTGLMASPDIYRRLVFPWQKEYCRLAHAAGLKVLKHCCGNVWSVIDELASIYDGWEGIQATAGMDIGKLKQRVRGKLCLWGGIWHEHIILGSVDDIRNDARYAFSTAAPGGGYIMGSTHSLAVDAKKANILEMKRCRNQWGRYPINPKKFV
jgi:uroporphyrinogen decarboxylase